MSDTVTADNGTMLPLNDMPLTFAYDGDFVQTITTAYRGKTYVQTFTNDGTNITAISPFMVQP